MKRFFLTLSAIFFMLVSAMSQNRTITGKVTDDQGKAVIGASVLVKGTRVGTTTNQDGSFSLSVPANARTLVVSSINMASRDVTIRGNSVDVTLAAAVNNLQEVVVVGYSTTTKEAFTGSAKVVSGSQLSDKNVSNISKALAGEVAGVSVINTSGQPGASATIRIRGFGSVNGNRNPLYVVDGVPFSGAINSINPEDVANVTVLKDAEATAIYGSRGANGVILINTKNGKGKKPFIEVDGKYGTNSSLLPRYDVLTSPEEYIGLSWEALYNEGVKIGNADPTNYANTRLFSGNGISPNNNIWNLTGASSTFGAQLIDPVTRMVRPGVTRIYTPERWQDYAFQPSNRTEANIKMGGGDSKTNYYTSFGYLNDIGYAIKTDFKRLSGRININQEIKSWLTSSFSLNYANTTTNNNGQGSSSNSVFWFVDNIPPIYPLFVRRGTAAIVPDSIFGGNQYDYGSTGRKFGSLTNSIADANLNTSLAKRNELTGNTSITIKFTKDLSLENKLGIQYYNNAGWTRNNKFYGSAQGQNGSISQSKNELMNQDLLNLLRYTHKFGSHNVEVFAAHEATKLTQTISSASGYNLIDNYSLELANAIVKNPTSNSYKNTDNLESYFSQVNYNYNNTYYVSGTIRRDGSSRFLGSHQWDNFPSVGLGWIVSKMNFMRNTKIIHSLKLTASYGTSGDKEANGSFYPAASQISIGNLNNNPSFGVAVPGNPDLTWEKSRQFDVGADFELGTYITGKVEYYIKNRNNLFFNRRVGPSNGYALILVNDGQLRDQGIDFELTGHILNKKNFYLDLGINGEHFNNKITVMPIDPSTGKQKVIDNQSPYAWAVGHSIYDFYIRNFAGVDPADGTSTWTVFYNDVNGNKTYDAGEEVLDLEAYYGLNPDKKGTLLMGITKNYASATQYYIGKSAVPKLRGAFNLNAGFHGIQLSVQMLYRLGGYSYDYLYAGLMANGLIGGNNWSTDIRNRWQKPGDITNVPRLSNNSDANVSSLSSRFITKADYLSLNNIRLTYNLPSVLIQRLPGIQQASLWVLGDNLWLLSARNGYNPSTDEAGSTDTYRYSPLSTITVGARLKF